MPKYTYRCELCKREYLRYKRIENIEEPEYCFHSDHIGDVFNELHAPSGFPMTRLFHASFQIIANREVDKRENDLYGILTKGGDQSDRMKLIRQDAAQMEQQMDAMPAPEKDFGTEEILNTGLLQAAQSGQQGIENWRRENIPPAKVYKEGDVIGI